MLHKLLFQKKSNFVFVYIKELPNIMINRLEENIENLQRIISTQLSEYGDK